MPSADWARARAGELDDRVWRDVGRQLRATWLVSGGYQRLGEVIRITARGVEVETGTVIRSVKIDGAISEIFALQDKIVYELSQGMNLTLHDSEVAEIERRRVYLRDRPQLDIKGHTAIIVDDGIATGATALAALDAARNAGPASLVLAVPVASPDTIERLRPLVDELICLAAPEHLMAISAWYARFPQLSDELVVALLDEAAAR